MSKLNQLQSKRIIAVSVVILILFCDQLIKFHVKTSMPLHSSVNLLGNWALLLFTENKGMAFGWDFVGTTLLTLFRFIAIGVLIWYLHKLITKNYSLGYIFCVAAILAGAAGNIIDNLFYGLVYSESTPWTAATLVPFGTGYGGFLEGRVVDMFYFPVIDTYLPEWLPWKGGERFIFFSPIFNFADAAITCGGLAILFFYRKSFSKSLGNKDKQESTATE